MKIKITPLLLFLFFTLLPCKNFSQINDILNPSGEKEAKPWTYWWWPGSAVDSANISYNLKEFADAGIGGVHIIPIYGVKGYEEKYIDYLSTDWMKMLDYTWKECSRIGLGLDMTVGTGWPFGGPWVSGDNSSSRLIDTVITILKNSEIKINLLDLIKSKTKEIKNTKLAAINAYYNNSRVDLLKYVDKQNNFCWTNSGQEAKVIILYSENSIQQVKRAAPGGKGNVVNPFSKKSLSNYLLPFTKAFSSYKEKPIRAFYHDSYEYYGADWSPEFPEEFKQRRGYNLYDKLPLLFGNQDSSISARIKCDYRNTISDLHEEFIKYAAEWSVNNGTVFRCQAHGSPANLLDIYAASSIPETEVFGTPKTNIKGLLIDSLFTRKESVEPLLMKFASSAAHIANKNLVSSETGTWLSEHFREKLSLVKAEVDQLFIAGINHVFFHGIPYSPKEEAWPGWQFYASTNFGAANSLWRNLPALNNYITQCQLVLQQGMPDNKMLLYFPIWDVWNTNTDGLFFFQMHNPEAWLFNTSFYNTAKELAAKGLSFDYISDKQVEKLNCKSGDLYCDKQKYNGLIIPNCKYMPVETLEKLYKLMGNGAKIYFVDTIPNDVPGYYRYTERRQQLKNISQQIQGSSFTTAYQGSIRDITEGLSSQSETGLAKLNLNFIKRKTEEGKNYLIINQNANAVNNWVEISEKCKSVILYDPLSGRKGEAKMQTSEKGTISVFLQLESGESLILKTYDKKISELRWTYKESLKDEYEIKGDWHVEFIEGGPVLPKPQMIRQLTSWTDFKDDECKKFFGTALYKIEFNNPNPKIKLWTLDLGRVCESARVKINNVYLGTAWAFPFKIDFENVLKEGKNVLEIEVTNCAANRIKDLDKQGVYWKKFNDINFVNINYKKFDASGWDYVVSGLLGPIKLIPLKCMDL